MSRNEHPSDPHDDTRGMTQRELILELREGMKELRSELDAIKHRLGMFPDRKEVYGVMVTVITLGLALFHAVILGG